jgi:hypothetical protein
MTTPTTVTRRATRDVWRSVVVVAAAACRGRGRGRAQRGPATDDHDATDDAHRAYAIR